MPFSVDFSLSTQVWDPILKPGNEKSSCKIYVVNLKMWKNLGVGKFLLPLIPLLSYQYFLFFFSLILLQAPKLSVILTVEKVQTTQESKNSIG